MDRDILRQIAGKYETPSYVFHIDELKKRIAMIREILGGKASLCYAMKANPFLVKPLKDVVDKYEVCSPGSLAYARHARFLWNGSCSPAYIRRRRTLPMLCVIIGIREPIP